VPHARQEEQEVPPYVDRRRRGCLMQTGGAGGASCRQEEQEVLPYSDRKRRRYLKWAGG